MLHSFPTDHHYWFDFNDTERRTIMYMHTVPAVTVAQKHQPNSNVSSWFAPWTSENGIYKLFGQDKT